MVHPLQSPDDDVHYVRFSVKMQGINRTPVQKFVEAAPAGILLFAIGATIVFCMAFACVPPCLTVDSRQEGLSSMITSSWLSGLTFPKFSAHTTESILDEFREASIKDDIRSMASSMINVAGSFHCSARQEVLQAGNLTADSIAAALGLPSIGSESAGSVKHEFMLRQDLYMSTMISPMNKFEPFETLRSDLNKISLPHAGGGFRSLLRPDVCKRSNRLSPPCVRQAKEYREAVFRFLDAMWDWILMLTSNMVALDRAAEFGAIRDWL